MPTIYTSRYLPTDVPRISIFTELFGTKFDALDSAAPAYIDNHTGAFLTRKDVKTLSLSLAFGMRHTLGAKRGDTVMLFSPNSLAWPIVKYGVFAAGLRMSPANTAYTPTELAHQLRDSGAYLIFVHPSLLAVLFQTLALLGVSTEEAKKRVIIMALEKEGILVPEADSKAWLQLEALLHKGQLDKEEAFDGAQADEVAVLCYSSGTTGLSKGVMTTHRNLVSQTTTAHVSNPTLDPKTDVMICIPPLYHMYGLVTIAMVSFALGIPVVMCPRFEPDSFCSGIQKYRVTAAYLAPPVVLFLANSPVVSKYDLSSLRLIVSGAAPLAPSLATGVVTRLAGMGAKLSVCQAYGLTETSPACTFHSLRYGGEKISTVGELVPNLRARLVDDDEVDVKPGERGELWVRGPNIMKGYLNNQAATANAITPDGWFKTGDIVVRDDEGFFTLVDRKKELIKYKGFQVPPAELEALLLTHPEIGDAGVIGVESEDKSSELPRAYIVPKAGYTSLSTQPHREKFASEIQTWVEGKVAKHKYLRGGVIVVEAIPKSAAGKILRRQLRDLAKAETKKHAGAKL
ncbi:hypothetical protein BOTBODRAFT_30070 [Botryobasidium botryosum FD-172 SS1]|uniref:AMP-dependent synthetase/ligase domain-containing protein n=1 Tax=Botryobasidium botryosum (strain FD-172 SS1) TaxID=930990 RepID=A0A067MNX5_BOTB1|nr:hypothetical protein BOTBODRAFT_30070 [Botryobasidium botryosum FD-172 SS1]